MCMTLFGGGPRTAKRVFEASLSSTSILSKEGAGLLALCLQLLHPSVQNNNKMIGNSKKYEWSVF
jgi:hypothetical protein